MQRIGYIQDQGTRALNIGPQDHNSVNGDIPLEAWDLNEGHNVPTGVQCQIGKKKLVNKKIGQNVSNDQPFYC